MVGESSNIDHGQINRGDGPADGGLEGFYFNEKFTAYELIADSSSAKIIFYQ